MKKSLVIFLCVLMTVSFLFMGCSREEAAEKEQPHLTLWEHTPQFEPAVKAVLEGFKEVEPNITIDYEIKTSDQYYNLLATAIQAGEAPDLFWTNGLATSNYPEYVKQGVFMDITDKVDFSMYSDSMFSIVDIDGKIYSTANATTDGRAVFYNKDIFNKLNLTVPKTFSEFEAMLPVIKDAGYVPIAFAGSDPWTVLFQFEPILSAMANDWILEAKEGKAPINDPRVAKVYEKMQEWGDAGYYGVGFTGVDGGGALLALSKGDAAMVIDGTWNLQTLQQNNPDLNLGAFHIPSKEGVRAFVSTPSCGFGLNKNTKYPEAGIKFLNYFASVEGQTAWVNALSGIPAVTAIISPNPVINEIADFDVVAESFYTILGEREKPGESPRKVWEEDQTKIFTGGITVQEFLDELNSMCN